MAYFSFASDIYDTGISYVKVLSLFAADIYLLFHMNTSDTTGSSLAFYLQHFDADVL